MLSRVAGPIPISAYDVREAFVARAASALWVEGLGLVLIADGGAENAFALYALQLDGRAIRIGKRLSWGGIGWAHDGLGGGAAEVPCLASGNNTWFRARLPTTAPLEAPHEGTAARASFAVLPDRVIWFGNDEVRWAPHDGAVPDQPEAAMPGNTVGTGSVMPARLSASESLWWLANLESGRLFLYDAVAKVDVPERRTSLGAAFRAAAYSRKHDLFFVVRDDGLHVYANEPAAASVSVPVFSSAPAVGAARELSAQVLGDLGEPCVGRVVDFEVTAGSVERAAVETDADGWARTSYRAPLAPVAGATATARLVE
jgi:hypothetical protein